MRGWRDWLIRHRVTVAVAIVAAATGAAGTALALPAPSSPHVVSLPVAGRTQATLNVMSGTPVLDIGVARLPGTLLRVSTPSGAPFRPVLSGSRPILLSLAGDGAGPDQKNTGYTVKVVLSSAVTWSIDLAVGYAANASVAGITIRELRIDLEGDLDLHAFLGLADGHPGFSAIRVAVHLDTDADEAAVADLHAKVAATSPVGQTLSKAIPVEISPA